MITGKMTNFYFDRKPGKYVVIGEKSCINMATLNFLGMAGNPLVEVILE